MTNPKKSLIQCHCLRIKKYFLKYHSNIIKISPYSRNDKFCNLDFY